MERGFGITIHDELASTSDTAKALAEAGAPHGTVICARRQTAGRGRFGRSWISPPGNLHVSVVLRPGVAPARLAETGFAAALAVADLLDPYLPAPARARLKWPNDVLVNDAKIAGILLEAGPSRADPWLVLGIGVNLRHAPSGLPYPVTSLAACGARALAPETALEQLVSTLGTWLARWETGGFAALRAAWLQRGPSPGTPLRVSTGGGTMSGMFDDLADDGALILLTQAGAVRVGSGLIA